MCKYSCATVCIDATEYTSTFVHLGSRNSVNDVVLVSPVVVRVYVSTGADLDIT